MKLHQKAFLLIEISKVNSILDSDLIEMAMKEYGMSGKKIHALRVALDELAAAGLIVRVSSRLNKGKKMLPGALLFHWRISEWGRTRLRDTGILDHPWHG